MHRKVQRESLHVLSCISSTRRQGQCKDIMSHISNYLHPPHVAAEQPILQIYRIGSPEVPHPPQTKNKYEQESQMWASLDETCSIVANIIKTEGLS